MSAVRPMPQTPLMSPKRLNQPTMFSSPTLMKQDEITPGISAQSYADRRAALFSKMRAESMLILPSAPQKYMSPDIVHKFRQNPDFLYLTGFQEPSSVLVLYKSTLHACRHFILFVTQFNPDTLTYDGHVAGTLAAKRAFRADATFALKQLDDVLSDKLVRCAKGTTLYYDALPRKLDADTLAFKDVLLHQRVEGILGGASLRARKLKKQRVGTMVAQQRLVKSREEIALMRESSAIAAAAMAEVMSSITPGVVEDRLAAMFEFGCRVRGSARLSAPVTISHGGENCILHYLNNDRAVADGALALMDTGAEYFGYASDITRVFPTNGRFSAAQLAIYEVVHRVQTEIIRTCCVVGSSIATLDRESERMLKSGLQQLGILVNEDEGEAQIEGMWHSGGVHFVSHWIGMDIHDCNDIGHKTKFKAGMCIAVEPGIYLPASEHIKEEYREIGVRIEDTVLITEDEPEVLTRDCPKDPQEIMELMRNSEDNKHDRVWKDAKQGLWSPSPAKKRRTRRRMAR